MEIQVSESRRRKVSVSLPLYRKHVIDSDHSDTTHYMRVDEIEVPNTLTGGTLKRLREVSVTVRREYDGERAVEIEVDSNYHFGERSEPDYTLGEGPHKSSAEEFASALQTAADLLRECAVDSTP